MLLLSQKVNSDSFLQLFKGVYFFNLSFLYGIQQYDNHMVKNLDLLQ